MDEIARIGNDISEWIAGDPWLPFWFCAAAVVVLLMHVLGLDDGTGGANDWHSSSSDRNDPCGD